MLTKKETTINPELWFTTDGKPYLTKIGMKAFQNDSTKWDIIRIFELKHLYVSNGSDLESNDYFIGPAFHGDGKTPNIFKLIIDDYDFCKFKQVTTNKSNLQKVRKDIRIHDFSWFKSPTGEYFFVCWNTRQIEPLSMYWTNRGINLLIARRITYEKMLKIKINIVILK